MDRPRISATEYQPTVQSVERRPIELVLRTGTNGKRREHSPDARNRRAVHQVAVLRVPADNERIAQAEMESEQEKSGTADAYYGAASDIARTSYKQAASGTQDIPVSAQRPENKGSERGLVRGYYVRSDAWGLHVSGGCYGLVQQIHSGLGTVEHSGVGVLCGGVEKSFGGTWAARDIEHRSGFAVHEYELYRGAQGGGDPNQHGRQRSCAGQRVHRKIVEEREVRRHIPARLSRRYLRTRRSWSVFQLLQHGASSFFAWISNAGTGSFRGRLNVHRGGCQDIGRGEIGPCARSWGVDFPVAGLKTMKSEKSEQNLPGAPTPMGVGRGSGEEVDTRKSLAYFTDKTVQTMGVST